MICKIKCNPKFQVTFHPPNEQPQLWKNIYDISPKASAILRISPKLTTTSASLHRYRPNVRRCFFNSERRLRFYKRTFSWTFGLCCHHFHSNFQFYPFSWDVEYTQTNCESECLANFTLAFCGCARFSMPSIKFCFHQSHWPFNFC